MYHVTHVGWRRAFVQQQEHAIRLALNAVRPKLQFAARCTLRLLVHKSTRDRQCRCTRDCAVNSGQGRGQGRGRGGEFEYRHRLSGFW